MVSGVSAAFGAGSGAHICGLYFMEKTGTNSQFAQYRGGAPAMQDLVGNQIDIMCAEASQTLAHVLGAVGRGLDVVRAKCCSAEGDVNPKLDSPSRRFCRVVAPFATQFKGLMSYTIPKVDVQVSSTIQSLPGPSLSANLVVPSGVVADRNSRAAQKLWPVTLRATAAWICSTVAERTPARVLSAIGAKIGILAVPRRSSGIHPGLRIGLDSALLGIASVIALPMPAAMAYTPFVTNEKDNTVTVRDRDSLVQERVAADRVREYQDRLRSLVGRQRLLCGGGGRQRLRGGKVCPSPRK